MPRCAASRSRRATEAVQGVASCPSGALSSPMSLSFRKVGPRSRDSAKQARIHATMGTERSVASTKTDTRHQSCVGTGRSRIWVPVMPDYRPADVRRHSRPPKQNWRLAFASGWLEPKLRLKPPPREAPCRRWSCRKRQGPAPRAGPSTPWLRRSPCRRRRRARDRGRRPACPGWRGCPGWLFHGWYSMAAICAAAIRPSMRSIWM